MNDMSSMNRERKKKELKRQVISTGGGNAAVKEEAASREERPVKRKRRRVLWILLLLAVAGGLGYGAYFYMNERVYTQFVAVWEIPVEEGGTAKYESFGTNVLKYTRDGMSYINAKGETVWMTSYEMKNPAVCVNGDYAVVADLQGNSIYICDLTGVLGQASTVQPVIRAVVSQTGVAAAILEDSASSYIQYYNRDGSPIDLTVKAALSGDGFPLDIALSPDGSQTIASYMYVEGGELKNRIVFYDFSEIGQNQKHLVGGFDSEFEDSIAARVIYPDETHACAFTERGISFFSSRNQAAVELISQTQTDETIESIFYSNRYVGMIVRTSGGENPYRMEMYETDGSQVFTCEFDFQYKHVDISGDMVILYNEEACQIYSTGGSLRYSGELGMEIEKITQGRSAGTVIVTGPQMMREIRLQG